MKTKLIGTLLTLLMTVSVVSGLSVGPEMVKKAKGVAAIERMIASVEKRVEPGRRNRLARAIYKHSQDNRIDPKIIVAIIDTESDFRNHVVSHTGDYSLTQINPRIWNRELKRLGKEQISIKELKKDETYAIERTAEILSIIKKNYKKRDRKWYARYHSKTKRLKYRYFRKLQKKIKLMNKGLKGVDYKGVLVSQV